MLALIFLAFFLWLMKRTRLGLEVRGITGQRHNLEAVLNGSPEEADGLTFHRTPGTPSGPPPLREMGEIEACLQARDEVREAARAMLARVAADRPGAVVDGFTVQPMVKLRQATELIVGASVDPLFGPVILFGQGGTAVEVVADRALALPPLNGPLAQALIARTRVARLLRGYRDQPAADMGAIERVLVAKAY